MSGEDNKSWNMLLFQFATTMMTPHVVHFLILALFYLFASSCSFSLIPCTFLVGEAPEENDIKSILFFFT